MDESVNHAGRPYGYTNLYIKSSCTDIYINIYINIYIYIYIYIDVGGSKRTCGIKRKFSCFCSLIYGVHTCLVILYCNALPCF